MPAPRKKRDPFLALSLREQCESLGIPFEQLTMQRSKDGWIFGGKTFRKPEPAMYAHYEHSGFSGTFCEGVAPLMLMKCASLNFLATVNIFNDRDDACLRYFGAQCVIHQTESDSIIDAIRGATTESIRRHFAEIKNQALYSALYPEICIDRLISIWNALGSDGWAMVATSFVKNPGIFSAGWPDLAISNGSGLRFIEIKTTDKLHASQKTTISDLLLPLGLSVSVAQLVKLN
jgi:hypothetical protein